MYNRSKIQIILVCKILTDGTMVLTPGKIADLKCCLLIAIENSFCVNTYFINHKKPITEGSNREEQENLA